MHVVVKREILAAELAFLAPVFEQQNSGWIELATVDGQLQLTTHNYSRRLTSTCPSIVIDHGFVCVASKGFADLCLSFDKRGDNVTLQFDGKQLVVLWGDLIAKFQKRAGAAIFHKEISQSLHCSGKELSSALSRAAGCSDVRNVDGSALIGIDDDGLVVATFDRVRLAEVIFGKRPAETFQVRSSQLPEIKQVANHGPIVTIGVGRHLSFAANGRESIWPAPVGKFPDYGAIFPATEEIRLECNTGRALEAVRRVRLADDSNIAMLIRPTADEVTFCSWHQLASEAVECSYTGGGGEIAIDSGFFRDALQDIETDRFEMVGASEKTPLMFRPIGADDYQSRCVVMTLNRETANA